MIMHPYSNLPDQKFWKRFVANTPWRDLALSGTAKFQLQSSSKIATAGSCFAQHIARYLNQTGRATYIAETPHPLVMQFGGETASYQLFSARYGNIYTVRQCLELFRQASGRRTMIEDFVAHDGRVYDLLRPNAIPGGFPGLREARADRIHHLACVRKLFETADVFVFTLGLTESWYHATSGHTYPVCPGTVHGEYDENLHRFHNMTHSEIMTDLDALVQEVTAINPQIKFIFTVSPVPLVATRTDNNVLVASSYSKSVLRAVCGEIETRHAHVQYFPSFEIVSHAASFGQYLAADLREISERGVAHVMSQFFATFYTDAASDAIQANQPSALQAAIAAHQASSSLLGVECEEIFNDVP